MHCSRIIGPALAGTIIALVGIAPCFLVNAFSFLAMFIALRTMDPRCCRRPSRRRARARRGAQSRCATCARTPELLIPLVMMALVGTISFNFQVLLPLLADFTWHGTAATYAMLTAAMGVGSVGGALAAGARGRVSPRLLVVSSCCSASRCCWPPSRRPCSCRSLALIPLGAASRDVRRGRELARCRSRSSRSCAGA